MMCEMPSAFRTATRKAAKQHSCCECGAAIEKGEKYQYSSGIWDGKPDSFKQCMNCHEIMVAAISDAGYCDEAPSFGMLLEWFVEFQCVGFTGEKWLHGMADQINVEPERLDRLLRVSEEENQCLRKSMQ